MGSSRAGPRVDKKLTDVGAVVEAMIRSALILLLALVPILAPAQPSTAHDEWSGVAAPRGQDALRADIAAVHDTARRSYGAAPVAWNDQLAADAMAWARVLAQSGTFGHDPQSDRMVREGENLSMGTRDAYSYAELAAFWSNERVDFERGVFPAVSRSGDWHRVGHYTQMVWPGTRQVGCAMASNATDDFLVCRYLPAGNVIGVAMR